MSAKSPAITSKDTQPRASSVRDALTAAVAPGFPVRPSDDESVFRIGRRTAMLLMGLVALTLLPRILLAFRLDAVCDDAYYYISVADAWERADVEAALQYLNVNIYPLILWGLHRIGFDWIVGGQVWGIVVSGLTILPLFGLVRRLYDDRVAAATCFLFAIHPELIESSIEPIRGPTFWFFFVTSLYFIWRAVNANRIGWYLVAGIGTTLAIHTRAEGWILLVPFCAWLVLLHRPQSRFRTTVVGTAAVIAAIPGFVVTVNCTVLKDRDEWELGRFTHFRNFYEWACGHVSMDNIHVSKQKPRPWSVDLIDAPKSTLPPKIVNSPKLPSDVAVAQRPRSSKQPPVAQNPVKITPAIIAAATPPTGPPPEAVSNPLTDGRGFTYLKQIGRKFEPIHLLLMAIGLCGCWRVMFCRDKIVLTVVFCGLMVAIWIRLSQIGDMNGRYFLSPFLVALPMAAIGLLRLLSSVGRLAEKLRENSPRLASVVPLAVPFVLTTFCITDAVTATHKQRRAQAKLGEWLERELGPFDSVSCRSSGDPCWLFCSPHDADSFLLLQFVG